MWFDEDERGKAKLLRDNENFLEIYLDPDLTPIQQRDVKKMRDEMEEKRKNGE